MTPGNRDLRRLIDQRLEERHRVKTVTADHLITDGEHIIFADTSSGAITVTLPSAIGRTHLDFVVKGIGANAVTVDVEDGGTIDGVPSLSLSGAAIFWSDNEEWHALGGGSSPSGSLMPYAGSSAPAGWLLCAGQAVSRTTYAALFAAIGTAYGAGDGSTTFNLPDLRGRVVAGLDNMGGVAAGRLTSAVSGVDGATLGAAGGDERQQSHAHAQQGTFDTTSGGQHQHIAYTGNTTAGVPDFHGFFSSATSMGLNERATSLTDVMTPAGAHSHSVTISGDTGSAGAGSSQNVQPTLVLNYIIKA